jgi:hypothetical protein
MKNLFKEQLENNEPITEESIKSLENETYFNGDKINIGDIPLFAMLVGEIIENKDKTPELPIELIILNKKHFDQFEPHHLNEKITENEGIPILKYKKL